MKTHARYIYRSILLCLLAILLTAVQASAFQVSAVGRLANFDGIIPTLWSKIAIDKERTEVITLNPRHRDIRIFNENGMELFRFGENLPIAGASDIELGEDGDMYLVYPRAPEDKLLRLDYKGEPISFISLHNMPEEYLPFQPERMEYLDGKLYMADLGAMNFIVTDGEGNFEHGYHVKKKILAMAEEFTGPEAEVVKDEERFKFVDLTDFSVDNDGNMYFTISAMFSAFKLTKDGNLQVWGVAGSAPGKFGVVAGITTDKLGNIYITDRLRSVVLIFDRNFNFITEFGYRGLGPGNLIVPDDVAVNDESGLIYVAQAASRGVSVFRIVD
jgi:hypothetical protein